MDNIESFNLVMGRVNTDSIKGRNNDSSWFEAMADSWGEALDRQADKIIALSDDVGNAGADTPATLTALTAESLKMSFMSNSSHTAISSVGSALDVMARKQ